jgi:hypothetical protein
MPLHVGDESHSAYKVSFAVQAPDGQVFVGDGWAPKPFNDRRYENAETWIAATRKAYAAEKAKREARCCPHCGHDPDKFFDDHPARPPASPSTTAN